MGKQHILCDGLLIPERLTFYSFCLLLITYFFLTPFLLYSRTTENCWNRGRLPYEVGLPSGLPLCASNLERCFQTMPQRNHGRLLQPRSYQGSEHGIRNQARDELIELTGRKQFNCKSWQFCSYTTAHLTDSIPTLFYLTSFHAPLPKGAKILSGIVDRAEILCCK